MELDVAIVGGGPAGSTVASILKTYQPNLQVGLFEREAFPRDHVGESLLPLINEYLDEMGVWDKVEKAGFPIKIGATYRWGSTKDLWNFEFLPHGDFTETARPGRYEGQRRSTSFQVDRSVYDAILLDHARSLGTKVFEQHRVTEVAAEQDNVTSIKVSSPDADPITVRAKYFVDASGRAGIIRRKFAVPMETPSQLRNVAIWDYWRNAEWAVRFAGQGTRIQVLSLGYGWVWFIPIGVDRTSVGLVVPAQYLSASGASPEQLYMRSLEYEPRVSKLLHHARSEGALQTTNDWSFVCDRLTGGNWLLAGDTCGFADPILSAGCTLAHASGREVAYVILELERGQLGASWLKATFEKTHLARIRQHIRFADYWYSANGQFHELLEHCAAIARDAGLDLEPDEAFRWLGTGGFANDDLGQASIGAYTLTAVKRITQLFSGKSATWKINSVNQLRLDLDGVQIQSSPIYADGRVHQVDALVRGANTLPLVGPFRVVFDCVSRSSDLREVARRMRHSVPQGKLRDRAYQSTLMALEAMLEGGWIRGDVDATKPVGIGMPLARESATIRFDG